MLSNSSGQGDSFAYQCVFGLSCICMRRGHTSAAAEEVVCQQGCLSIIKGLSGLYPRKKRGSAHLLCPGVISGL